MQGSASFHSASQARRADGDFFDIAQGKPTSQSSYSEWSSEGESALAVVGRRAADFAFHTALEASPWWEVDLLSTYPIESIVVHNRISIGQERADRLRVEVSRDRESWELVHAGFLRFGAEGAGGPLELTLGGAMAARYVRLSIPETQYLHLSQVEVFAKSTEIAIIDFRREHNLPYLRLHSEDPEKMYTVHVEPGATKRHRIVGLKICYSSRFGNLFQQYTHAILLAKKLGLKYIQLGTNELFDIKSEVVVDGVTFLPQSAPTPTDGAFLSGVFFDSNDFLPILSPFLTFTEEDEAEHANIARKFFRHHLLTGIALEGKDQPENELTIHIRSGDIFDDSAGPVNTWYRQPPLAFYTLVIKRLREAGDIDKVKIVYEDRGNPCVDLLEQWAKDQGVPVRTQSVSLAEDMSALVDAPHLVFGHGTFGYAACRLSVKIRTLHFFAPELGGRYAYIPNIERVYSVSDAAGRYIKAGVWGQTSEFGEWENTPEQLAMMGWYPEEDLKVELVRSEI